MKRRKCRIQFSVHTSDGVDREFCKISNRSGNDDCNQGSGNLVCHFCPEKHDRNGQKSDQSSGYVDCADIFCIDNDLVQKFRWNRSDIHTEEVFQLSNKQGNSNTTGKSGCDRVRNVFDQRTEPADSHDDKDDTGEDGCDDQTVGSITGDNSVNNNNKCSGRSANLNTASSEEGDKETGDDRGVKSLFRSDTGSNCECD